MLAAGCFSASAQEATTKEVFNPHWYVQGQVGMGHTLGEIKFADLTTINAQVAFGYQFSSVWGARLTVGGWQAKGGNELNDQTFKYDWKYVAPTLNVTFNVTNAIFGFNPNRVVDFTVFAGAGANIGFSNDKAAEVQATMHQTFNTTPDEVNYMSYIWEGTKTRPVGQFGASVDFKVSKRVSLGIEANCNFISDKYNSKKAKNSDWYFNALAGVKVALGKTTKTVAIEPVAPIIQTKEIVRVDTIYIQKDVIAKDPMRRDVFFTIRGSEVSKAEMPKIEDIAAYLNKYKDATVTITGYADKGTGNPNINIKYAKNRADMVAKILIEKFGIAASRITTDSKGDAEQPYDINDLNRVSICIAK